MGGLFLVRGCRLSTGHLFVCSHTIQHICRSENSFSHFIWLSITNIKKPLICCRTEVTSHGQLTTFLQATAFWEGPWKTGFIATRAPQNGCLGTHPEAWKEEWWFMWFSQYSKRGFPCSRWASYSLGCGIQVASSPCFPILPTHPKPSSTLVLFPLNYHVFSSKRSLQVLFAGETDHWDWKRMFYLICFFKLYWFSETHSKPKENLRIFQAWFKYVVNFPWFLKVLSTILGCKLMPKCFVEWIPPVLWTQGENHGSMVLQRSAEGSPPGLQLEQPFRALLPNPDKSPEVVLTRIVRVNK